MEKTIEKTSDVEAFEDVIELGVASIETKGVIGNSPDGTQPHGQQPVRISED